MMTRSGNTLSPSLSFSTYLKYCTLFTMKAGGGEHNGWEFDTVVNFFDPLFLLLYNGAISNPFGEGLLRIICSDVCQVLSVSPRYALGARQGRLYGVPLFLSRPWEKGGFARLGGQSEKVFSPQFH